MNSTNVSWRGATPKKGDGVAWIWQSEKALERAREHAGPNGQTVYVALTILENHVDLAFRQSFYASQRQIAHNTGLSVRTIRDVMLRLVEAGLVATLGPNTERGALRYTLTKTPTRPANAAARQTPPPGKGEGSDFADSKGAKGYEGASGASDKLKKECVRIARPARRDTRHASACIPELQARWPNHDIEDNLRRAQKEVARKRGPDAVVPMWWFEEHWLSREAEKATERLAAPPEPEIAEPEGWKEWVQSLPGKDRLRFVENYPWSLVKPAWRRAIIKGMRRGG